MNKLLVWALSVFLVLCLVPVMAQQPTTALYRWYNSGNGDHFYTTDPEGEAAPSSGYISEGITGYVKTSQASGTTALYRWYNSDTGDHFYTTDQQGELAQKAGYAFEGEIGYIWTAAPKITPPTPTNIALYRWYNSEYGYHFYATDLNEVAPFNDWVSEGITGYIKSSQAPGTIALYRWYNSDTGDHFYTTDPQGEAARGYVFEGIIGYIWTKG